MLYGCVNNVENLCRDTISKKKKHTIATLNGKLDNKTKFKFGKLAGRIAPLSLKTS